MFHRTVRVRYSECDAQGVLFNSHYLAYCDHVMDDLLFAAFGNDESFQVMLKSAQLEWQSPARYRDDVEVRCHITRWGQTSLDVQFLMFVAGKQSCQVDIRYVHVRLTDQGSRPAAIPPAVRNQLEHAIAGH